MIAAPLINKYYSDCPMPTAEETMNKKDSAIADDFCEGFF
jgi:hypothetical protein